MNQQRRALLAVIVTGIGGTAALWLLGCAMGPAVPPEGPLIPANLVWQDLSALSREPLPFQPGEKLKYAFGWNGVRCADLTLNVSEEQVEGKRMIVLNYEGGTRSVIALVWSCEVRGKTWLEPATLLTVRAERTSDVNKKKKRSTMTYDHSRGLATTVVEKLYKNKESTKQVQFYRHGLDLTSALMVGRLIELPEGKKVALEVVHGDKDYALEITGGPVETVEVEAGTFKAQALDLRVCALTGDKQKRSDEETKYRSVRVWIAKEGRLPIKLESDVFVGQVYVELVSVKRHPPN